MGLTKKTIYVLIAFVISVISFNLFFVPTIETVTAQKVVSGAHRGNSLDYIENTLPAFQSAVEKEKYNFIEFDVQYTKDEQAVVYHDKTLLRLQKKLSKIGSLTYKELLGISDYHIPLYSEVMDVVAGKKPLNIEIKSRGNFEEDRKMVDFIVADIKNRGILDSTLISSISSEVIEYVKEKYPEIKTGKVYYVIPSTFLHSEKLTKKLYDETEKMKADYIMLYGSNLNNYNSLKSQLPKGKTLVIWYFTDEIYIVQPIDNSWVFKLKRRIKDAKKTIGFSPKADLQLSPEGTCLWWC